MIVLHHFVFWYVTNSLVHEDEAKKIDLIEQANKSFETTRFLSICKIIILIFSRLGVLGRFKKRKILFSSNEGLAATATWANQANDNKKLLSDWRGVSKFKTIWYDLNWDDKSYFRTTYHYRSVHYKVPPIYLSS